MKNYPWILSFLLISMASVIGGERIVLPQDPRAKMPSKHMHSSTDVFLISPCYTVDLFFNAMILQPTTSYLHYAVEAVPLPVPSPHWKIFDIRTDYDFGFDLGAEIIFHGVNTSLTLDWQRFHSDDTAHKQVQSDHMIGPFFEIGPDAEPYKQARGHVSFHFDQINLDYGQFVQLGRRLRTNLFAGVGFARIKQTLNSRFSNLEGNIVRTIHVPSLFTGGGPQMGMNFTYCLVKGFQFVGGARGSLFVGSSRSHTDYSAQSPTLALVAVEPPNNQSTRGHKRTQVVPGLEGQLGLAYAYIFHRHYMFKVEAGYEAQVYFNAIQSTDIGSEVVTPPVAPDTIGVFARTFQRTLSNFALAGPYIKIEFGF